MATRPSPRIYAGPALRDLRGRMGLSQQGMAAALQISVSYLSQIESGDRPLTLTVMDALARSFPEAWATIDEAGGTSLLVRALQASTDPSIPDPLPGDPALHRVLSRHPTLAKRIVALHDAVLQGQNQSRALDDRIADGAADRGRQPWEEVRDWFHHERNYVDAIDRAAEEIGTSLPAGPIGVVLARHLDERYSVTVESTQTGDRALRAYDASSRILRVDPSQQPETTSFSLAHQLARLELSAIVREVADAAAISDAARQLLLAGLGNYAAAALLMPYRAFRAAARELRHDIDRLRQRFGTSFEQTCHRLSTLQRPGASGVPFFFCRIDMAGNITKRHSATRLQFARFGGACPLWIVHEAVAVPDRIVVQLAATPDDVRYVSMAKGLVKPSGSYSRPTRRYAVALGCEAEHAAKFVYADDLRLHGMPTPIGTSCRVCPRVDCEQRAFPPAASDIRIDHERRGTVPYQFA